VGCPNLYKVSSTTEPRIATSYGLRTPTIASTGITSKFVSGQCRRIFLHCWQQTRSAGLGSTSVDMWCLYDTSYEPHWPLKKHSSGTTKETSRSSLRTSMTSGLTITTAVRRCESRRGQVGKAPAECGAAHGLTFLPDRILFRGKELHQMSYSRAELRSSDHRPGVSRPNSYDNAPVQLLSGFYSPCFVLGYCQEGRSTEEGRFGTHAGRACDCDWFW
jgi:hypothetical protein